MPTLQKRLVSQKELFLTQNHFSMKSLEIRRERQSAGILSCTSRLVGSADIMSSDEEEEVYLIFEGNKLLSFKL